MTVVYPTVLPSAESRKIVGMEKPPKMSSNAVAAWACIALFVALAVGAALHEVEKAEPEPSPTVSAVTSIAE